MSNSILDEINSMFDEEDYIAGWGLDWEALFRYDDQGAPSDAGSIHL